MLPTGGFPAPPQGAPRCCALPTVTGRDTLNRCAPAQGTTRPQAALFGARLSQLRLTGRDTRPVIAPVEWQVSAARPTGVARPEAGTARTSTMRPPFPIDANLPS
ncbi:hypothetical protein GCM10028793_09600 [Nocardiopsis oceani]